LGDTPK